MEKTHQASGKAHGFFVAFGAAAVSFSLASSVLLGTVWPPQAAQASISPKSVQATFTNSTATLSEPLPPLLIERTLSVKRGQTLVDALKTAGFNANQTKSLTSALAAHVALTPFKSADEITLSYAESAPYAISEASLSFRPQPDTLAHLKLKGEQATASVEKRPLKTGQAVVVGHINDSLWQDATAAGLPAGLVKPFMDLFAFDLDYTRDLQPGDTFKISFEETTDDRGRRIKTGRILGAQFTVGKQTQHAYWWAGGNEYLNEKGDSKRKLLLRTPVEVYRISSNFGVRRHPVLGYTKMHKGTDFAAPTGTPVKASGDGVITYLGPKGPSGNLIIINHAQGFQTAYAHLHRFAKGLRVGSKVSQGQYIAQVGTTGRSTGPHLHYEVRTLSRGQYASVDPMSTKLPTGNMLSKSQLANFKASVSAIQTAWAKAMGNSQVASR